MSSILSPVPRSPVSVRAARISGAMYPEKPYLCNVAASAVIQGDEPLCKDAAEAAWLVISYAIMHASRDGPVGTVDAKLLEDGKIHLNVRGAVVPVCCVLEGLQETGFLQRVAGLVGEMPEHLPVLKGIVLGFGDPDAPEAEFWTPEDEVRMLLLVKHAHAVAKWLGGARVAKVECLTWMNIDDYMPKDNPFPKGTGDRAMHAMFGRPPYAPPELPHVMAPLVAVTRAIHLAVIRSDRAFLADLFGKYPSLVNARVPHGGIGFYGPEMMGDTPFITSVRARSPTRSVIELLIISGAWVDTRGYHSNSGAMLSMIDGGRTMGNESLTIWGILCRTSSPNGLNYKGTSAMHRLATCYRDDFMRLLLEHNTDVDVRDMNGNTPLHLACLSGYTEKARMLLAAGADPDLVNSSGTTPRMLAEKRPDVMQLLSERSAGPPSAV